MGPWRAGLALLLLLGSLLLGSGPALAAEVLQVRSATLLQVGDHNRTYSVELACLTVEAAQQPAASAWLREQLPRRTRVNLRPLGNRDGLLLAQVQRLPSGSLPGLDLGDGLVQAGLASALPHCSG
ncbi:MAG: nuclease [Vulcanococcus sp.]